MTADHTAAASARRSIGPYSRMLARGTVNGRSREGRFLRAFEAQLTAHVGGAPSITQRMLISRLARVALRLELFDEKLAAGPITDVDSRTYGALHNSFRLMLRDLGIKGAAARPATLAEVLAQSSRPAA